MIKSLNPLHIAIVARGRYLGPAHLPEDTMTSNRDIVMRVAIDVPNTGTAERIERFIIGMTVRVADIVVAPAPDPVHRDDTIEGRTVFIVQFILAQNNDL